MKINEMTFGTLRDGKETTLYNLENDKGMKVSITNYGGIITEIIVPDKSNNFSDVTLGFEKLEDYEKDSPFIG